MGYRGPLLRPRGIGPGRAWTQIPFNSIQFNLLEPSGPVQACNGIALLWNNKSEHSSINQEDMFVFNCEQQSENCIVGAAEHSHEYYSEKRLSGVPNWGTESELCSHTVSYALTRWAIHSHGKLCTHAVSYTLTRWAIHSHGELCTLTVSYTLTRWAMHSQVELYTHTLSYALPSWAIHSHCELYAHTVSYALTRWAMHSHGDLCTHTVSYAFTRWCMQSHGELCTPKLSYTLTLWAINSHHPRLKRTAERSD
jgi:hypothetical protein